jgi:AcrR family transcriptional regulator
MPGRKRRPADESKILLVEAAVEIIRTEGYGALSARRLAERVGLKRQIVHYHFGTIEELLLAVVRHYGDSGLERLAAALETEDPLRVIWETDPDASATAFAFMAMATHSPVVRAELQRYLDANRKMQMEAIVRSYARAGMAPPVPPIVAAIVIQSVSQALAAEAALGAHRGHAETRAVVEAALAKAVEGGAAVPSPLPDEDKRAPKGTNEA